MPASQSQQRESSGIVVATIKKVFDLLIFIIETFAAPLHSLFDQLQWETILTMIPNDVAQCSEQGVQTTAPNSGRFAKTLEQR